ncbi:DUF362 domain-containing protein [Candidatus Bathyarchaeota archaeon]|nr:DUF362 domain-containing protein [Candidatus Bathyarchaeota archaeon]MBS7617371.1 DUF362 domain-containing protein [Candidatus Bathyarchaeota archaeon]
MSGEIFTVVVADIALAIKSLNQLAEASGFKPSQCDIAVVKPNICGFYPPNIDLLKTTVFYAENYAKTIYVGDTASTMHSPKERFKSLSLYEKLRDSQGVKLVDFSECGKVNVNVVKHRACASLPLPSVLMEAGLFINLAKAGSHPTTRLTCCIKNMFGLLMVKSKFLNYHAKGVDKVLADLVKVIPRGLHIAEINDKVLLGVDPFIVDLAVCRLLGMEPTTVRHLTMIAEDRGLNVSNVLNKLSLQYFQ